MFLWSGKRGTFQKHQNTSALPQMLLTVRRVYHILEVLYRKIERSTNWHCVPVTQWHRRCPGVQAASYTPVLHTTHSAFVECNCLTASGMMTRTSGLEGYGGKPWLNLGDHAMQKLLLPLVVPLEDQCHGAVGSY